MQQWRRQPQQLQKGQPHDVRDAAPQGPQQRQSLLRRTYAADVQATMTTAVAAAAAVAAATTAEGAVVRVAIPCVPPHQSLLRRHQSRLMRHRYLQLRSAASTQTPLRHSLPMPQWAASAVEATWYRPADGVGRLVAAACCCCLLLLLAAGLAGLIVGQCGAGAAAATRYCCCCCLVDRRCAAAAVAAAGADCFPTSEDPDFTVSIHTRHTQAQARRTTTVVQKWRCDNNLAVRGSAWRF